MIQQADWIEAIRARVDERDDSQAMMSACGEYNCQCHYDLPHLLAKSEEDEQEIASLRTYLE